MNEIILGANATNLLRDSYSRFTNDLNTVCLALCSHLSVNPADYRLSSDFTKLVLKDLKDE